MEIPGQINDEGVNPSSGIWRNVFWKKHVFIFILGVVVKEPKPVDELEKYQGLVGLEELAKTDRILVQQVSIYFNLAFH